MFLFLKREHKLSNIKTVSTEEYITFGITLQSDVLFNFSFIYYLIYINDILIIHSNGILCEPMYWHLHSIPN